MSKKNKIGILLYGQKGIVRDIYSEEKYKKLAHEFAKKGIPADTITYNDYEAGRLPDELTGYKAILVWINPVEPGMDRELLENMLRKISAAGVYISAHPETILKIGVKEVLYRTKNMSWSCDVNIYKSFDQFESGITQSIKKYKARVLKPNRGNGGKGIIKLAINTRDISMVDIRFAEKGKERQLLNIMAFIDRYSDYFDGKNYLIDHEWCEGITNGMVRCYSCIDKVAGFGYQEINMFYPNVDMEPSKRYYYTESCGLFSDLRAKMENKWIPQLMDLYELTIKDMPIIWDADFFINDKEGKGKYTLCEINASSVSPFPDSAILPMTSAIKRIINA